MNNHKDRRKHPRYDTEAGAKAELINENNTKVGIITDISKGGLSFRYINFENNESESLFGNSKINISKESDGFILSDLDCKIVMNHFVPNKYFFILEKMSKYSIQFHKLSPAQRLKLEYFINHYTDN